ncbi:uncharacterized protein A4U43_C06F11620 [Asparagus officinalis]|uniref:Uncharacterized protein n=1 Tax=Asparagus officinalis TaxID=4686 RepID=A0A5P1ELH0_ASPOF|nr:uncharacterized protein A4U43_C06F11620 [Asparagus officinalis]
MTDPSPFQSSVPHLERTQALFNRLQPRPQFSPPPSASLRLQPPTEGCSSAFNLLHPPEDKDPSSFNLLSRRPTTDPPPSTSFSRRPKGPPPPPSTCISRRPTTAPPPPSVMAIPLNSVLSDFSLRI